MEVAVFQEPSQIILKIFSTYRTSHNTIRMSVGVHFHTIFCHCTCEMDSTSRNHFFYNYSSIICFRFGVFSICHLITARLLSNWVWILLQWDLNTKTDIKLDFKRDLVDSSHWDVNRWINLELNTQSRWILRQVSQSFADHLNKFFRLDDNNRSQRRVSAIDLCQLHAGFTTGRQFIPIVT